ncbi:MAG: hypothetical protein SFU85_02010 [Candidatus Methylacidiphilales bacterium]|nr:hypothetical protein [Candidatus Methylacidiphilales bacterium]
MATKPECHFPLPGLVEWSAHSPTARVTLTAHAFSHEGKVILVDPIEEVPGVRDAILGLGQPVLIVLTNGNHERASVAWKKSFNIPTAFSAMATRDISYKPDVVLETAPSIHGVHPLPLAGAAPGEHALHIPHLKLLILGDALINLAETGLSRLPDKYCSDPAALRLSLGPLAKLGFEHCAFAHGTTLVRDGKSRLLPLLQPR